RPVFAQPVPLAPVALLSDPTGSRKQSWEFQVERRGGSDRWHHDKKKGRCVQGADGLYEMLVTLPLGSAGSPAGGNAAQAQAGGGGSGGNACLLQLGTGDVNDLAAQLVTGVSPAQFQQVGGQLVLGPKNQLVVPGTPWGPRAGSAGTQALQQALQQLQAQGAA